MARYKKVYKFNRRKATFRKVKPKRRYYKKRYHKKKKTSKLTKFRLNASYPDLGLVKLRNRIMLYDPGMPCVDQQTVITAANTRIFNLNASCGGTVVSDVNGTRSFQPLNFHMVRERYCRCRPMGMKLVLRIMLTDSMTVNNTPIFVTGFPYQSQDQHMANYWNETGSPLSLTGESIGQIPYAHTVRLYGGGSKPYCVLKHYISFPRLLGLTKAQYMARDDVTYDLDFLGTLPNFVMKYCLVGTDFNTAAIRLYNCEAYVTQYCRFEGPDIYPF